MKTQPYLSRALTTLFLIALSLANYAQNNNPSESNGSLAEKIYLQLDRQVYSTHDTIWFKCIVANAFNHKPSQLSGILHVEKITPDEQVAEKKLIKLENGIGNGFFSIEKDAPEGIYQIRGYTEWNKNFDDDFFFTKNIQVFSGKTKDLPPPISKVTLVKNQAGQEKELKVRFDAFAIDKQHKGKLKVFVSTNSGNDSIKIAKSKDNTFWLNYDINNNCEFVTLKMQTNNGVTFSKTILVDPDYVHLQFFPESGELVHGLPSNIGFKACDVNGEGVFIKGDIVDEAGSVITSFKSNKLGMGCFGFENADTLKTYYARTISKLDSNQYLLMPLPKVNQIGNILLVEKIKDKMQLTVMSNYLSNEIVTVLVSCRGIVFMNQKVKLTEGMFGARLRCNTLPGGIVAVTVLDNTMQPVAERLFFNNRPEERLNIELSTNKAAYAKRELTKLEIVTSNNNGKHVDANLSVLAINKKQLGEIQKQRQNILSYFLLGSELRGEIEDLGFYFSIESNDEDLDVLMLTQGWRKYKYSKPYADMEFKPERNLVINGTVKGGLFDNKKQAVLTLMTFGQGFQAATTVSDSTGRFRFELDDEFGDEMAVVIQPKHLKGKKMNYALTLDKKNSPPVTCESHLSIDEPDSLIIKVVEKYEERKKVEDAFQMSSGSIVIGQVDVDGYKRTPKSSKIIELAGHVDQIIGAEELIEKEEDWSFGLYGALMYCYDNIEINELEATVTGSDTTLVLINGAYDRLFHDLIETLPSKFVTSIDVVRCADNFIQIYFEATGEIPTELVICGSIININTVSGLGIHQLYKSSTDVNRFSIPVFSTPKEFYAPNYETLEPEDWEKPDLRALLHWQPVLKTNEQGTASTCFYNADNLGDMMIVVEAISSDGRIGYKEITYKVDGKKEIK